MSALGCVIGNVFVVCNTAERKEGKTPKSSH